VEAHLSRALSVPVVRRHARGPADSADGFHYGPAVRIVSGNFVTGKRRGVVDGTDFGATGSGACGRGLSALLEGDAAGCHACIRHLGQRNKISSSVPVELARRRHTAQLHTGLLAANHDSN
jgi:hypothetical protein